MKKIKFLKNNLIRLDGLLYTPYLIGDLPPRLGFIADEDKEQYGITSWFNFRGFTYIAKE